jgi:hypothetical protein
MRIIILKTSKLYKLFWKLIDKNQTIAFERLAIPLISESRGFYEVNQ